MVQEKKHHASLLSNRQISHTIVKIYFTDKTTFTHSDLPPKYTDLFK